MHAAYLLSNPGLGQFVHPALLPFYATAEHQFQNSGSDELHRSLILRGSDPSRGAIDCGGSRMPRFIQTSPTAESGGAAAAAVASLNVDRLMGLHAQLQESSSAVAINLSQSCSSSRTSNIASPAVAAAAAAATTAAFMLNPGHQPGLSFTHGSSMPFSLPALYAYAFQHHQHQQQQQQQQHQTQPHHLSHGIRPITDVQPSQTTHLCKPHEPVTSRPGENDNQQLAHI